MISSDFLTSDRCRQAIARRAFRLADDSALRARDETDGFKDAAVVAG